jgi:hypothetical protein
MVAYGETESSERHVKELSAKHFETVKSLGRMENLIASKDLEIAGMARKLRRQEGTSGRPISKRGRESDLSDDGLKSRRFVLFPSQTIFIAR